MSKELFQSESDAHWIGLVSPAVRSSRTRKNSTHRQSIGSMRPIRALPRRSCWTINMSHSGWGQAASRAQQRTCSTIQARSLRVERVLPAAMVSPWSITHTQTDRLTDRDTLTGRENKDKPTSVISLQDPTPPARPASPPTWYPASGTLFKNRNHNKNNYKVTKQTTHQKLITQLTEIGRLRLLTAPAGNTI